MAASRIVCAAVGIRLPLVFAAAPLSLHALEIPLTRGSGESGTTVGVVDMEAVFQAYPETQKAKRQYFNELARRRQDLAQSGSVAARNPQGVRAP